MATWANYLISAVRFNAAGTHIDMVRVHEDKGEKVGVSFDCDRQTVVDQLKRGYTYATIYKSSNGWKYGAEVGIFPVNGVEYIRTYSDQTQADNLDDLPTF